MEFLTKPVQVNTGKVIINLRLLLNDRQNNIIIMVTNEGDTKRKVLTSYPYHYTNFKEEEESIKEYILESLEKDYIYSKDGEYEYKPELATDLINYLKNEVENKINASTNFPEGNKDFYDIYKSCQEDNRTNSEANIIDVQENGKPTTAKAIVRDILITKYQDTIDKINNGESKEFILDCNDFEVTVNTEEYKYVLTEMLKHSPEKFITLVDQELEYLIHEKSQSDNPYEVEEDTDLYYLRFKNLSETTPLKYLLSDKVGRFTQTQGLVQGVYEITPKLKNGVFECKGCLRHHEIEQPKIGNSTVEPSLCSECGGRSFKLLEDESTYTNERVLLITEPPEELDLEDNPRQLQVNLIGDKNFTSNVNAGTRVNLTGILGTIQDGEKSKFVYNVNNLDKVEDKTITLTPEEKTYFLKLSKKDNIMDILVNSFAPDLILPREIKEAILLYIVKSGEDDNGLDMIHILIITDPSMGKTKLKERTRDLLEKVVLASGTGASGRGLTGAVVKDPIIKNWVLTAGAVPLANNGHCIIDEIDKMGSEDASHLNNFMESGYDNFDKADVHGILFGKTSILALGNPIYGRYDRYKSLQEQVTIEASNQSRYDLTFLLEDVPETEKDSKIIESILNAYGGKNTGDNVQNDGGDLPILSTEELKKYLAFARNEFNPILEENEEAYKNIKEYGVEARASTEDGEAPYDLRFVRSVPKLAGAYAKLHLRGTITKEDVEKATHLKDYSIKQIGVDPITKRIDPDRVTGNLNKEDKRDRTIILELITEYVQDPSNLDSEGIPAKTLLDKFKEETGKAKNTYYTRLKELKNAGEVLETGKGKNKKYSIKSTR